MLTKNIPTDLVSGIFVCNAHRVLATTTEVATLSILIYLQAFILRLYRYSNRRGFIRAITDHPEGFMSGFALVEKVLKALWLRTIHIWPRFEKSVIDGLATCAPSVVELRVCCRVFSLLYLRVSIDSSLRRLLLSAALSRHSLRS
jgi:DNA excision repair protein ERCC-4